MATHNQFKGLPMEQLIGAPLSAICEGQVMLASATKDYIETVGLDENKNVRMIDFIFQRPHQLEKPDGSICPSVQDVKVSVPFISIVSVPTLQVNTAKIDFCMEVKSTEYVENHQAQNTQASMPLNKKNKPSIIGSVTKKNNQNSTTYQIEITAKQSGTPEGLSRLMDILHRTIIPIELGEPRELNSDNNN